MGSSALIFKVNQLGDNVVFLPALQRLVCENIFESLTVWTTPLAAPLFRNLPVELHAVSRDDFYPAWKKPSQLLRLAQKVRKARPDLVLVAEDMGNTAYFLALVSGATHRIGTRPPYLKIPLAINEPVTLDPAAPEPEKAWRLLSGLAVAGGGAPWTGTPPPPSLSHLDWAQGDFLDIIIHAGASREYKRWPLARFHELAGRLARDFKVGWCMAPDAPPPPEPAVTRVVSRHLDDLVSHIARASLFIGNNSGPMNIASALGTPSVIFIGPSPRSWDPYWHRDRFRILRKDSLSCIACGAGTWPMPDTCTNLSAPVACMTLWSVDEAEAEVRSWHERHAARKPIR
jgi:heptosyltransferase-3